MVLLTVSNSVNMTLYERTQEFGVMRALGQTGRAIFRIALLETALLGAMGAALGITVGTLLALAASAIGIPMPPPPNSESGFTAAIRVVPMALVAAFFSGLLASIGAALLPARRLARTPVVEALRYGA
jgi:putative ABC transport system permease protein